MTEEAPLTVVATAGHVDHGKSSLILRLTGTDPDRLAEEKRRGLTIELGYAWCTLPSGREVGFVDVPGHERFVRTMLAGVGPVRLVLFVVAADEGWKPQSEEHLEIVDVLGVDGAVIAITKRDVVDAETLELARTELRERVAGTALEDAPVVACSATTGEGIPDLIAALDTMIVAAPEPEREGRPRWFIDRVFTVRGAGTVATGTLTGGPLTVGEEVELHPSGVRARVRGLQTHQRAVEVARPVSRVAANLASIDRQRLDRGDVVTRPGEWRPTTVFEARLMPVRSGSRSMTARGAFSLHAGSAERAVHLRLYGVTSLPPEGCSRGSDVVSARPRRRRPLRHPRVRPAADGGRRSRPGHRPAGAARSRPGGPALRPAGGSSRGLPHWLWPNAARLSESS
jgi:selenocysteine-specific elongation factor